MINVISSEIVKLKRTYFILVVIATGLFFPGMLFIGRLMDDKALDSAESYVTNVQFPMYLMLSIIVFSLIAAYVFSREYTNKTANITYTYPTGKIKIFVGKLMVVYLLMCLVYFIQMISCYIAIGIFNKSLLTTAFLWMDLKVNLYSLGLQFVIVPIPIFIANLTKNIIAPVVCSVFAAIINAVAINMDSLYAQAVPFLLPTLPCSALYKGDVIDFALTTTSAVLTFVIGTGIAVYHFYIMDVE